MSDTNAPRSTKTPLRYVTLRYASVQLNILWRYSKQTKQHRTMHRTKYSRYCYVWLN